MRSPDLSRLAAAVIDRVPPTTALAATRMMGMAARVPLPPGISRMTVEAYARFFGVNLDEIDPASLERGYASFDAFFTRTLRDGARPIDKSPTLLTSPCDGLLRDVAPIEDQGVVLAKGHAYAVDELLGDAELAARFVGGLQAVIYLHPRDYHRVHAPVSGLVKLLRAIPGRLLPVNDAGLEREPRLFALNERHVHLLHSDHGAVAVVMIAAFGVGHMSCSYAPIEVHPSKVVDLEPQPSPLVTKGEELGVFHLGSTVVLLTEPGFELLDHLGPGSRLHLGQGLFEHGGAA